MRRQGHEPIIAHVGSGCIGARQPVRSPAPLPEHRRAPRQPSPSPSSPAQTPAPRPRTPRHRVTSHVSRPGGGARLRLGRSLRADGRRCARTWSASQPGTRPPRTVDGFSRQRSQSARATARPAASTVTPGRTTSTATARSTLVGEEGDDIDARPSAGTDEPVTLTVSLVAGPGLPSRADPARSDSCAPRPVANAEVHRLRRRRQRGRRGRSRMTTAGPDSSLTPVRTTSSSDAVEGLMGKAGGAGVLGCRRRPWSACCSATTRASARPTQCLGAVRRGTRNLGSRWRPTRRPARTASSATPRSPATRELGMTRQAALPDARDRRAVLPAADLHRLPDVLQRARAARTSSSARRPARWRPRSSRT